MKKLKAVVSVIIAATMSFAVFAVTGCHSHTFSSDWVQTETEHWRTATCEHADEKGDYGEHSYNDNYVCTVCGYKHTHTYGNTWTADDSGHWYPTECGHDVKYRFAAHRYNTDYVCAICGYDHKHSYSTEWEFDADKHWHADVCNHRTTSNVSEHDWDETYTCRTCGYVMRDAGISISKVTTEYVLSAKKPTVDIAVNDISVKLARVNESLVQDITDYDLKFYRGSTELENLNGVGGGAYNIWASATVMIDGAPVKCESFVIVYVIDNLTKLAFNKTAATAVTTQSKSVIDRMSDSWTFTASFASGRTEQIASSNCLITGLDTNKVTAGSSAAVTYSVRNAKGESISKAANVYYTISQADNNVETNTYSFDALKNTLSVEQQKLSSMVLPVGVLGGNEFMTVLSENVAWYRGPTNNLLEIQNDSIKVTITGVGTISLAVDSTSSTNISSIALKDSNGNLIAGTPGADCVEKDDTSNSYSISGKGGIINFIILTPGEYTICTVEGVTVKGEIRDTNRHTRIQSLVVVDERS